MFSQGHLFRLWSFYQHRKFLNQQLLDFKNQINNFGLQIRQTQTLDFIEYLARDRYEYVDENDIVFLFPDEERE